MSQFENVRETLLEVLMSDPEVGRAVEVEAGQRFGDITRFDQEVQDELVCTVQLLVYDRVLKGIIG